MVEILHMVLTSNIPHQI